MTLYQKLNIGSNTLARRLGSDVHAFLGQVANNNAFLSDYEYLKEKVADGSARGWQLEDYAPLLLPLVKYYENSLWYVCEQVGLFDAPLNKPRSLRSFFDTQEPAIKGFIDSKVSDKKQAQTVYLKLFSTVEDYNKRNEVVHCGELISYSDLENYDSMITQLKDLVDCLFSNNLLLRK